MKKAMVFILLMFISLSLLFSLVACNSNNNENQDDPPISEEEIDDGEDSGNNEEEDSYDGEDPGNIISKILVVSDVHINAGDDNTKQHLKNTLTYARNSGINAIIFNGDTPNLGREEDYVALDAVFTETYVTPKSNGLPELIFNLGNHEFYPTGHCAHEETDYNRELGKFKAFAEKWGSVIEDNVFVRDVNGIKCVLAFPSSDSTYVQGEDNSYAHAGDLVYLAALGGYSENDVQKVKAKFDSILASGYEKSIIFCTHHPLGEVYGSTLYGMDSQAESLFKQMLKKYPMVVHLSGHTHFSSLHERSFSQGYYTSIQTGMHTYGKYVNGVDKDENRRTIVYENMTGKQYNTYDQAAKAYHGQTNFGMLLSFTEKKMVAERVYLSTGEIYEHGKWLVPYGIKSSNYHRKFYYEKGERTGEELHFGNDVNLTATVNGGKLSSVTFKEVNEYWACEGYEVVVKDASGNSKNRFMWASHFWMGLDEKQTYDIPVKDFINISVEEGDTLTVRAINFFGYYSGPVTINLDDSQEGYDSYNVAEKKDFNLEYLNNWRNSGATLCFRIKPTDTLTTGDEITFNLQGSNPHRTNVPEADRNGCWNRLTQSITINLNSMTASVGTLTEKENGWYLYSLALADAPLNNSSGEEAYGDETLKLLYFNNVNHSFEYVSAYYESGDTSKTISSSAEYTVGDWNTFVAVDNWKTSGKKLIFEFKPSSSSGSVQLQFNKASTTNAAENVTINYDGSASVGTVIDIEDGWYRYEVAFADLTPKSVTESDGSETITHLRFRNPSAAITIDKVDTTIVI